MHTGVQDIGGHAQQIDGTGIDEQHAPVCHHHHHAMQNIVQRRGKAGLGGAGLISGGGDGGGSAAGHGHIGKAAHHAAIGQSLGAHLQHGSVGPGALVVQRLRDRVCSKRIVESQLLRHADKLAVPLLPVRHLLDRAARFGQTGGQFEQGGKALIGDGDVHVGVQHDDAVVDMGERGIDRRMRPPAGASGE